MKNLLTILLLTFLVNSLHGQQVITQWIFNGTTEPFIGEGEASLIGGTIEVDLDDRWRMVGFPDQFEDSGTAGAEFMVSTEGYKDIVFTFGHRSSGTQSRWAEVQYTTDGGDSWKILGNNVGGLSPHDVIYNFEFDLSDIPGASENPHFGLRIVSIFSPLPFNPEEPDEDYEANTAYHRARTEGTGGNPYAGGPDGGNWRLHNVTILGDPLDHDNDDDNDHDLDLLHFMVFDSSLPNDTPFETLAFTYSNIQHAFIHYYSALEGYPFNEDHPLWRKASMERRNAPTSINYLPEGNYNIAYADVDMRGLQVRQPFRVNDRENTMVFHLPTILHNNLLFAFAAKDEGAADQLIIDYSITEGEPQWLTEGLQQTELILAANYQLYQIDFKDVPGAGNNPNFHIRIRFDGSDMGADDGDRVTFNNFSLHGKLMDDVSVTEPHPEQNIKVNPNPASTHINITLTQPTSGISIFDINGRPVLQKSTKSTSLTIDISMLTPGLYFIQSIPIAGHKTQVMKLIVQ